MVKPVNVNEMVLRAGALLRRAQMINDRCQMIGNTILEWDTYTVITEQESVILPQKEFMLLYKMASYPNRIFTRQQLMDEIWGYESESNTHTVDVHIGRLPERLADFCVNARIKSMVNQVELHPFFQQTDALENMKGFGVIPEAWGPLAEGKHGIFTNEILTGIAQKYGKTAAQVVLRWNVQRGVVIIPKSVHKERMEENFNIWDFSLSEEDMQMIAKLDLGHSEIVDHTSPETAKWLNSWKIHD